MASITLATPPVAGTEPITLDEAKHHCRIDIDDDDQLLTALIIAARQHVEHVTGRQLLLAQWALKLDGWPCWVDVPRAPLFVDDDEHEVVITYRDTNGNTQTLASSNYEVDAPEGPTAARGTIHWAEGATLPSVQCVPNSVTVTYYAGYGETSDTVPQALKQAMLIWLLPQYQRRAMTDDEIRAFRSIVTPFKTWGRQ